jgi:carboxylesterase type B
VSFNYRLGAQGYLWVDGVPGAGNFGTLDQVRALEWVQENIEVFGGDPSRVTIAGESAGGSAVGTLMAVPAAKGLFHRAIAQSGAAHNGIGTDTAGAVAARTLETLSIHPGDVDALRSVPLDQLLRAEQLIQERSLARNEPSFGELMQRSLAVAFQPAYGTDVLPRFPIDAIRDGSAHGIDVLVGTTAEELLGLLRVESMFGRTPGEDVPESLVELTAQQVFQNGPYSPDMAVSVYRRRRPKASNLEIFAAMTTDWSFRIAAIRLAEAQQKHAKVRMYELAWRSEGAGGSYGAGHALDIPLIFDTCDTELGRFLAGDQVPKVLIDSMHLAWVNFVATGDPGHDGMPNWPTYDNERRATMCLDIESSVEDDPRGDERELWTGIV